MFWRPSIATVLDCSANRPPFRYMARKNNSQKANKTETVEATVTIPFTFSVGKESTQTEPVPVVFSEFPKSIGNVLRMYHGKLETRILGCKIVIPSLTANNTNFDRFAATVKQLATGLFPADKDATEKIPETSEAGQLFTSIRAAGFKFQSICKAEVVAAVNVWLANKRAKKNLATEVVKRLNGKMIAETAAIRETVKGMKIETGKQLTGHTAAYSLQYGKLVKELEASS